MNAQASPRMAQNVLYAFVGLFFLHGLEAYSLGPIPIDWMGQAGFMALGAYLAIRAPVKLPSEFRGFVAFFVWALLVTVVSSSLRDYSIYMPPDATNPYPIYMALRVVFFLAFFGAGYSCWWLCRQGLEERLIRAIVLLATFFAMIALYIFVAHIVGLPEPPRTRMGTTGQEQATEFALGIQRALGTFREPSHLACWMLLPLMLALRKPGRLYGIPLVCIGLAIILSASLTAYVSVLVGLLLSFLLFGWRSKRVLASMAAVAMVLVLSVFTFDYVAQTASKSRMSLYELVTRRIEPLVEDKSLKGSNRGFIYQYVESLDTGPVGDGWGNGNLRFAHELGTDIVAAFSSLYLAALVSTGQVGFLLLVGAVIWPLARALTNARRVGVAEMMWATAGYIAWATSYTGLYEELYPGFALALAFLAWQTRLAIARRNPEGSPPTLENGVAPSAS